MCIMNSTTSTRIIAGDELMIQLYSISCHCIDVSGSLFLKKNLCIINEQWNLLMLTGMSKVEVISNYAMGRSTHIVHVILLKGMMAFQLFHVA